LCYNKALSLLARLWCRERLLASFFSLNTSATPKTPFFAVDDRDCVEARCALLIGSLYCVLVGVALEFLQLFSLASVLVFLSLCVNNNLFNSSIKKNKESKCTFTFQYSTFPADRLRWCNYTQSANRLLGRFFL
jgi:hypothetical protein